MAPTFSLCLVVGFDASNVPTNLYTGYDLAAARIAAAAAAAALTPTVRIYRGMTHSEEFLYAPPQSRVLDTVPAQSQQPDGGLV
jgi:hypothetical protein